MDKCRSQYFKEIDIVEHIMQFREVRADLELKLASLKKSNTQVFKRSRTRVMKDHEIDSDQPESDRLSDQTKQNTRLNIAIANSSKIVPENRVDAVLASSSSFTSDLKSSSFKDEDGLAENQASVRYQGLDRVPTAQDGNLPRNEMMMIRTNQSCDESRVMETNGSLFPQVPRRDRQTAVQLRQILELPSDSKALRTLQTPTPYQIPSTRHGTKRDSMSLAQFEMDESKSIGS